MGRLGIEVGDINILVYVRPLVGYKYVIKHGWLCLEKQWSDTQTVHPYQTVVKDISVHSAPVSEYKNVESVFESGSTFFMLGQPYYGARGEVMI